MNYTDDERAIRLIKEYKELYDSGAITEEEFMNRKKALFGDMDSDSDDDVSINIEMKERDERIPLSQQTLKKGAVVLGSIIVLVALIAAIAGFSSRDDDSTQSYSTGDSSFSYSDDYDYDSDYNSDSENADDVNKPPTSSTAREAGEYEPLQEMFKYITIDTTEEEALKYMDDAGLTYYLMEYEWGAHTYKVALSGDPSEYDIATAKVDFIDIDFDPETGAFENMCYYRPDKGDAALLYNYGYYADYEDETPGDHVGYYYLVSWFEDGYLATRHGKSELSTRYVKCDSAEQALEKVNS